MSFVEKSASGRALPTFFRSTWAWVGSVLREQKYGQMFIPLNQDSPEHIKILVTVFTFHKPMNEAKLQNYIYDALMEYERHFQNEQDEVETGFEAVQVSHDEARGLGFYRVAVTVDDVEERREALY